MLKSVLLFPSRRKWTLMSLCVITPMGFLFKFYSGPLQMWFNNYGAGVLYEIFWCLFFFLVFSERKHITNIAVAVLIVTCILETLQLWHPGFLEDIRRTFAGKALLGTTFVWWDFPHYILGCLIGWFWMRALCRTRC